MDRDFPLDLISAVITEGQRAVLPDRRLPRSVPALEKAGDSKDVFERRLELKFKRETDPIAGQVLQQERIDEHQIFSRNDPLPTDLDRVFQ